MFVGIAYAFRRWAHFVSKNPYRVIICATLFAVVWTVAFFFQLTLELDNQDLFTPKDAKSFEDKDYVDSLYESYPERVIIGVSFLIFKADIFRQES